MIITTFAWAVELQCILFIVISLINLIYFCLFQIIVWRNRGDIGRSEPEKFRILYNGVSLRQFRPDIRNKRRRESV